MLRTSMHTVPRYFLAWWLFHASHEHNLHAGKHILSGGGQSLRRKRWLADTGVEMLDAIVIGRNKGLKGAALIVHVGQKWPDAHFAFSRGQSSTI